MDWQADAKYLDELMRLLRSILQVTYWEGFNSELHRALQRRRKRLPFSPAKRYPGFLETFKLEFGSVRAWRIQLYG